MRCEDAGPGIMKVYMKAVRCHQQLRDMALQLPISNPRKSAGKGQCQSCPGPFLQEKIGAALLVQELSS